MTPSYKENQTNRALLVKLFGEKWIKKRDEELKRMREAVKPKTEQLKLEL